MFLQVFARAKGICVNCTNFHKFSRAVLVKESRRPCQIYIPQFRVSLNPKTLFESDAVATFDELSNDHVVLGRTERRAQVERDSEINLSRQDQSIKPG